MASIRLRQEYFGKRTELPTLCGRTVILVDDGLASGFTMEAAVQSVRGQGAERVLIAVPTSSRSAYIRLKPQVDNIVCPDVSPPGMFAVANAYETWYDVSEDDALNILENFSQTVTSRGPGNGDTTN